jgi:DNA-directed RNA polymerase specialized sigma24 family protein
LAERLAVDLEEELFFDRRVLLEFEPQRGSLASYLAGFARRRVKRYLQKRRRHQGRELRLIHDVQERVTLDGEDLAQLREVAEKLAPQPRKYFELLVFGNGLAPGGKEAATDQERQWLHHIRKALQSLDA